MTTENIKTLITLLGFISEDRKGNMWAKKYSNYDNYTITLDFEKSSINYGDKIEKGDNTTSNFSSDENFVVLDCIDRLLSKGYKPQDLTLEKKWKLGRSTKSGKADINVADGKTGKTVLIIECKTWGTEFEKEKERMRENGGQLFSYFQQDKATRFLCLYTSQLTTNLLKPGKFIDYKTAIVKVEDTAEDIRKQDNQIEHTLIYQKATDVAELVRVWNHKNKKQFDERGIFEEEVEPYNPGFVPLRVADLKEFNQYDSKKEYNEFEEILRHNNISDRSNAFNRFISLVLAKLRDEEINFNKIADFQFKDGIDDNETIIEKLQSLYTDAMYHYLGESVTNYRLDQIENIISHFPRQTAKEELKRIYKELKFYTNNEFSFKEIYNKELFDQNAKVVIEIIKRLQGFRFKYNAKAQFLGDFFEDMLESGFKQSEGQFFTPTPIAKFIVSAMPLKEIIERKIGGKESDILPCIIDYACGSGHFITESIENLQDILQDFKDGQHEKIQDYKKSTEWAESFICGIEKDYRLARTSKVACYMHGDGKAKIIFGDGLENHFEKLPDAVKNGNNFLGFDILVANPPYTIKDFKKHLNKEKLPVYELLPSISDDSDDIEVLFVERTKQLLKDGGFAGIFLPSTILNSTGIYTRAREIILKYFEIKGIVEFGSNTFSATSTNTIVLFLKRRSEDFAQNCFYIAEDLILGKDSERKEDFIDSHKLLQNYASVLGINITDYITLLKRIPSTGLEKTEYYQNYKKWFADLTEVKNWKKGRNCEKLTKEQRENYIANWFFDEVLEIEKEKFFYFLLAHKQIVKQEKGNGKQSIKEFVPQQTLIVKSGKDNETQKAFLGYTFSDRRGYKGLDMKKDANGKEITKLYDKENLRNLEKVNTYIYKAFSEDTINEIPETLSEHITPINLVDTFDFERIVFEKQINTSFAVKKHFESKFPLLPLSSFTKIISGIVFSKTEQSNSPTDKIILTASNIDLNTQKLVLDNLIYLNKDAKVNNEARLKKGDIFLCTSSGSINHLGKSTYIEKDYNYYIGGFCSILRGNNYVMQKYISSILQYSSEYRSFISQFTGSNINNLRGSELLNFKIPVPPKDVQDRIVKEIENVEKDESKAITQKQNAILSIESSIRGIKNQETVGNIAKFRSEKVEPKSIKQETGNYIGLEHIESNNAKLVPNWQPTINATIKSAKNKFYKGDLLYGKLRPYLNKVWIAEFDGYCSTDILVLQTKSPIVLKRILLGDDFVKRTTSMMKGMSLPRLEVKQFKEMKIQYPTMADLKTAEKDLSKLDKDILQAEAILAEVVTRKMEILKANVYSGHTDPPFRPYRPPSF